MQSNSHWLKHRDVEVSQCRWLQTFVECQNGCVSHYCITMSKCTKVTTVHPHVPPSTRLTGRSAKHGDHCYSLSPRVFYNQPPYTVQFISDLQISEICHGNAMCSAVGLPAIVGGALPWAWKAWSCRLTVDRCLPAMLD